MMDDDTNGEEAKEKSMKIISCDNFDREGSIGNEHVVAGGHRHRRHRRRVRHGAAGVPDRQVRKYKRTLRRLYVLVSATAGRASKVLERSEDMLAQLAKVHDGRHPPLTAGALLSTRIRQSSALERRLTALAAFRRFVHPVHGLIKHVLEAARVEVFLLITKASSRPPRSAYRT